MSAAKFHQTNVWITIRRTPLNAFRLPGGHSRVRVVAQPDLPAQVSPMLNSAEEANPQSNHRHSKSSKGEKKSRGHASNDHEEQHQPAQHEQNKPDHRQPERIPLTWHLGHARVGVGGPPCARSS